MTAIAVNTLGLTWAFYLSQFLILLDVISVMFWGGNMIAVNLEDQNDERYTTLVFWRLAIMAIGLIPAIVWFMYIHRNKSTGFLFMMAFLLTLVVVAAMCVFYGWFIIDIIDCENVVHCTGPGDGPLGIDFAFWVVLVTTGVEIIIAIILTLLGILIRRRVQYTNLYNYFLERNRPAVVNAQSAVIAMNPQSMQSLGCKFSGGHTRSDNHRQRIHNNNHNSEGSFQRSSLNSFAYAKYNSNNDDHSMTAPQFRWNTRVDTWMDTLFGIDHMEAQKEIEKHYEQSLEPLDFDL